MPTAGTPRLSLCIATMNRAGFIGETLLALLTGAPASIEVVILDGGSTDGTEAVIAAIAAEHPEIRYIRQAAAGGVDADFDAAVQQARGAYCWLMSDDDLLKPGSLQRVLRELESEPDLVIVNAEVRSTDMSHVLSERVLKFDADRTYGPGDAAALLGDTGGYLSFIGGVVIRRNRWNERERERYYGSLFIHVGVIFQAPLNRVVVLADPMVVIRYGNALWAARGFEIWMLKWPNLIWSFGGLSDAAKNSVTPRYPWRKAGTLLFFRAKGAYSMDAYRRVLRAQATSLAMRAKLIAVALVPGPLALAIAVMYFHWRHPEPAVPLFELRQSRFHFRSFLSRR